MRVSPLDWKKSAELFLRVVEKEFYLRDLQQALSLHCAVLPNSPDLSMWLRRMGWVRGFKASANPVWRRAKGTKPEYTSLVVRR